MGRAIVLAGLLVATACGGSVAEVPEEVGVSYREHVEPVILKRCLGCHTEREPKAALVLEQGRGYAELVDQSSVQVPSMRLVTPGDADRSYLWLKVDHAAPKGEGMPRTQFGARRLPEPELRLMRRWIVDGARP